MIHIFGIIGFFLLAIAVLASLAYAVIVFGEIISHDTPNDDQVEWGDDWVYSTTPLDTEAEDDAEVQP
jgi:hypothetical protein